VSDLHYYVRFISVAGKVYRTGNYCLGNAVEAVRTGVQIVRRRKRKPNRRNCSSSEELRTIT